MNKEIIFFVDVNIRKEEFPLPEIESHIPGKIIETDFALYNPKTKYLKDKDLILYFNKELNNLNGENRNLEAFFITCDKYIPTQSWYKIQKDPNLNLSSNLHLIVISLSRKARQEKASKWYKREVKENKIGLTRREIKKEVIKKCRKVLT